MTTINIPEDIDEKTEPPLVSQHQDAGQRLSVSASSALDHEQVARLIKTDVINGLTTFEARERLKRHGKNVLGPEGTLDKPVHKRVCMQALDYLAQFANPLIQLLLICCLVSVAIGEYGNAASVAVAIVIVCTISYVQERRADKSLEKLHLQMPQISNVVREAQPHEIESCYLVPGDIVLLAEGQRVPADVRLFEVQSLSLNESNLTGETQSQPKVSHAIRSRLKSVLSGEQPLVEDKNFIQPNIALMGTIIESGHARGIVIATGSHTRYGEVSSVLQSTAHPRSPLQCNIEQLSLHLVVGSCFIIGCISILGIVQQRAALDILYYSISLAVTAIPEGLPVAVAVIMAVGVVRLSRQKTIIKSIECIETLGCVQVLCADKTGTLTRDYMTLTDIVTSELHSLSSGELDELNSDECRKHMTFNKFGGKLYAIGCLMEAGTLCNNASFNPHLKTPVESTTNNGGIVSVGGRFIGQATDCAILQASMRMGFGDSRGKFVRLQETPFSASSRRMAVQCKRLDGAASNGPMWYVKGAWEDILADCTHYFECGLIKPKSDELWKEYERICTTLGSQGLRVLALATGSTMQELTFVGIVGINNAPREGIADTLDKLRASFKIDVKMITGDSRATAVAVGRALHLLPHDVDCDSDGRQVMSGQQVQKLLDCDMSDALKAKEIAEKCVFYRVDPMQKANIVSKLQELDKIVAMTGDGVNDVISLKRANLSLVMGSGADVCKEIADVVLVDDNLCSLLPAIIEGKGIYLKIHSFLAYQLSLSLSLLMLTAVSFATNCMAPFTVIQVLFINILADGPPAQSLAVERVRESELEQRARNVHEPLLSCKLLCTVTILTSALLATNGLLYYFVVSISVNIVAIIPRANMRN